MSEAASRLGVWWLASRPATLWAALAPVIVGTACAFAERCFSLGPALAALGGAVWIQIGTNLSNDLFDFLKGADTEKRLGPVRAVQAGLLSPRQMAIGTAVAFAIASLFGVYLVVVAGWVMAVVGVASVLSGLAYTAGPFPLGYHGLGDLFVFVFFGLVAVIGTCYVQCLSVPALAVWSAVAMGALSTAILVVNNLRDLETDAAAGKRTLAVRWGATATRAEYLGLLAMAYGVPVVLAQRRSSVLLLLPCLTLPFAVSLVVRVTRQQGAALNAVLEGTARLLLLFAVLQASGIALAR